MSDRKPFLFGSVFLLVIVGAVGSLWLLSSDTTSDEISAIGPGGALAAEAAVQADPAGEPIEIDRTDPIPMTVYLSPTCGCCEDWVGHIEEYGFEIELEYTVDIGEVKRENGIRPELASCHTAIVNGYVMEGHVPGDVVRRFLSEAPAVRGLAVPGMPIGSPGMEMGDVVHAYDVLAFTSDGRTEVYSRHGR